MKEEIFQFKITLTGSNPTVWRRFLVNNDMTFQELHEVIQLIMGWKDQHMFGFNIKNQHIVIPALDATAFGDDTLFANEASLHEFLRRVGGTFIYTYDFSDNRQHQVVFEKRLSISGVPVYPLCIEGAGGCPPEDCGVIENYYQGPEGKENTEPFQIETVNQLLRDR